MQSKERGDDGPETVTGLHARWQRILDNLNNFPGIPNPRREARLVECGRLEREIGRTPARNVEEIILKLRMVLTGKTTAALSESALLAGAIEDLQRMVSGGEACSNPV